MQVGCLDVEVSSYEKNKKVKVSIIYRDDTFAKQN